MLPNRTTPTIASADSDANERPSDNRAFVAPSISLPKGGGAIHGIGEKFSTNPVTGTGSMVVPVALSPGRSGFGPQLTLSYDSGAGNGPLGFGWNLSLPSIVRKTDNGLPRYRDADESDVFMLSGAEDLAPVLNEVGTGRERDARTRTVNGVDFLVQRYRPRVEGLFARIEKWTDKADAANVFWRSISRDNVTTWYGKTAESRIADPADPSRVFSWLICESYDDKGNAILHRYKAEDSDGIDTATLAHERNRTKLDRSAARYLKRIQYGNRTPRNPDEDLASRDDWLFEAVLDYGEHYDEDGNGQPDVVVLDDQSRPWTIRQDPFSHYRAGFELRTYRLCQRILMFHHFPGELGVADCLVHSTDFAFNENGIGSFISQIVQSGYVRKSDGTYFKKSLPSLELEYSQVSINDNLREVDPQSLENLPAPADGTRYRWVDLDGEGLQGVLAEQEDGWYYKRNVSPLSFTVADGKPSVVPQFDPITEVATLPSFAETSGLRHQFLDMAGDGQLDCVVLEQPAAGFFERTEDGSWDAFRPLRSLPNVDWNEPNLRFVDLTGDGHADVVITEDDVLTWYPSLGETGFGTARRVSKPIDEEQGPAVIFADANQAIFAADMSGDGLADIVRIRNGDLCYWPNLGYGRFGAKVAMDHAPWFDVADLFDQRRIRLADIDGSGTTDIIYLASSGVRLYFNQSGNGWSGARPLDAVPPVDNLTSVEAMDLVGNGTACLVWTSSLPGDARRTMRYVDLMGGQKPHLLIKMANNLGAETHFQYAPCAKFFLADRLAGRPWITRLPFPVQVVERIETLDRISGNRFVTRFAYHHGYFDGHEREFRGFGQVDQWDTEEFAALRGDQQLPPATNIEASSHVPPVLTRTWFHTGVFVNGVRISNFFAGLIDGDDVGEYYREPGLDDDQAKRLLLEDTILPAGLTGAEEREACRALKGAMLRQEVYALDGTDKARHPIVVTEQNLTVERLQPRDGNRHAVFFAHPRESIAYQYERNPGDPRTSHNLTLEVDAFANVRKSAAVVYARRQPDAALEPRDRAKQAERHVTYSENAFTNGIDSDDAYRTPALCESRAFELTGLDLPAAAVRFTVDDLVGAAPAAAVIAYEQSPTAGTLQKRLIECVRTIYRRDDLTDALSLGLLESLALPFESYRLAFTPGLVAAVYGARVTASMFEAEGGYVHSEGDDQWWIPSGRLFFSSNEGDTAATERDAAHLHFFLTRRYRDRFGQTTLVRYDAHDLLVQETQDALMNTITVGERDASGNLVASGYDYRLLQPRLVTDANGNRVAAAFDALGMLAATAVMSKRDDVPGRGDRLDGLDADLPGAAVAAHLADPFSDPHTILRRATTRLVYDLFAYHRTREQARPAAVVVYTLTRETHDADLAPGERTKVQHRFSYSDGFGREIQKKFQAEPGPVASGGPDRDPRWVGSGWTIFNNKGAAVRTFEPFFTSTHAYESDVRAGVSPIVFYDPVGRAVAALHPDHTWEKVKFDPWRQESWDVNDTALVADPKTDTDVGEFFRRLDATDYLPTWRGLRTDPASAADFAARYPDPLLRARETQTARKTEVHAATPSVAHSDSLGRTFLTIAHNAFKPDQAIVEERYATRVEFDIQGNQRAVVDANDRIVMRYDYNLLGKRIHQASMEGGERRVLHNASGQPVRAWDSRNHAFRTVYDRLQRPTEFLAREGTGPERLIGRIVYGESRPTPETNNLRGEVVELFDQAGIASSDEYDFKGNALVGRRQLAQEYRDTLDWSANPALEPEVFSSRTAFDALNRPVLLTAPDQSIYRPTFNEANLLERVEVHLRGAQNPTPFVANIDYNAKGQRIAIEYGNGVTTEHAYDPLTFRASRTTTGRPSDHALLQDLSYTYDAGGNVTHIGDGARQTVFFDNQVVTADNDFTYDAVYRLIAAGGREHIGQASQPETTWDDRFRVHLVAPTDAQSMRAYTEQYHYDAVGNFVDMIHRAVDGNWTRRYDYDEPSLVESGKRSNRLSRTTVGTGSPEQYTHDPHGNMSSMPHLSLMAWDDRDQLHATSRQAAAGSAETTYYVYDANGRRTRKVTERQNGSRRKERLYLGGFEVYREYGGDGVTVTLQRETLHVMDDAQRLALVETRTIGSEAGVPEQLVRYQFGNHLGSASLELDEVARIISYEEYYPHGSTSFQSGRSVAEASLKRYRYTAMERDEETGFGCHGARCYVPWLGRWSSCEPMAFRSPSGGGTSTVNTQVNLYVYAVSNPLLYRDADGLEPVRVHGTTVHAEILPVLEDRINELKYYSAETDVRTLLPGSTVRRKGRDPWGTGQIDLVIFATSGGRHVYDLKPKFTSKKGVYDKQIVDYVYKLDVPTAATIGTVLERIYESYPSVLAPVLIDKGDRLRVYELSLPIDRTTNKVLPGFIEYETHEYRKPRRKNAEEFYQEMVAANSALAPSPAINRGVEVAEPAQVCDVCDRERFFYIAVNRAMEANKYANYDITSSRFAAEINRRNERAMREIQNSGRGYTPELFIDTGGIPMRGGWGGHVPVQLRGSAGQSSPAYMPQPTGSPGFAPVGLRSSPSTAPSWSPQPQPAPVKPSSPPVYVPTPGLVPAGAH